MNPTHRFVMAAICALGLTPGSVRADPADPLPLAGALALALEHSPRLAAFSWDIRAAEARALQARLRPNPKLSIEVEGVRWEAGPELVTETWSTVGGFGRERERGVRSGFGGAEITISLSQLIELGGKRAKRIRLAARGKDVAAWDYEIARVGVMAQVAKAFVTVLAAQEEVELRRELARYAEEVEKAAAARVKAGKISPLELKKARIELSSAGIEAQRSVRELEAARVQLAATWGEVVPVFERVAGRLDAVETLPSLDDLRALTTSQPDIARWAAEIASREAALKLEKAQRVPDVSVALGFRTEGLQSGTSQSSNFMGGGASYSRSHSRFDRDRDNSLVFEISLPLPLFDRNQGAIKEAQYLVSKAAEERRAARVDIQSALAEAYQTAMAACEEAQTLQTRVLPEAEETFALTQRGFRQGKFDYLNVLDVQRTLVEARARFLNAQVEYHQSVVEIERLTGEPVRALDDTKEK